MTSLEYAPEEITVVSEQRHQLAEGPVWCAASHSLYWVDIPAQQVWRRGFNGSDCVHWNFDKKVSAVFTTNTDKLVVVLQDEVAIFDPASEALHHFCTLDTDRPANRSNDAGIAPDGSLWVGTMDDNEIEQSGRLWRIAADGSRQCMLDGIGIANTFAWDTNRGRFYFADSIAGCIYQFPYPQFADIRGTQEPFARITGGVPDGSTLDRDGCLWNAQWDGGVVVRYSPDAKLLSRLELPVRRPTSCCFGGPSGTTLFITTASVGLSDADLQQQPLAGQVLAVEVDATGAAERPFIPLS